jgi:hypothetical protein
MSLQFAQDSITVQSHKLRSSTAIELEQLHALLA